MVCVNCQFSNCSQDANSPHALGDLILSVANSFFNIFNIFIYPAWLAPLIVPSLQGNKSSIRSMAMFPKHMQFLQDLVPTVSTQCLSWQLYLLCFYPIALSQESPFRFTQVENLPALDFLSPLRGLFSLFCSPETRPAQLYVIASWLLNPPHDLVGPFIHLWS